MNIVNQLFSNPIIKNAAFSTLRKIMQEHNLKGIYIIKNESDDFDFSFINEEQVIIPKEDFDEMKKHYLEYLNK